MGEWTTGDPLEWTEVRAWPWPWVRASVASIDGEMWSVFVVDDNADRADLGMYESRDAAVATFDRVVELMRAGEMVVVGEDDRGRGFGMHLDVIVGHFLGSPEHHASVDEVGT